MPITQSSFCSPSRTTQAYRESMNSRNPRARVKQPLRRSKTMMIGLHSHCQSLLSHLSSPLFISPSPRTHPTPLTILATQVSHLTTAALAAPISSDSGHLFREKLLYLQSINVNPQKALRQNPNFRSSPLSSLQSVESCLASFGIPRSSLGRILDMFPQLLTSDPHSDLYPVFDFLLNEVHIPFPDLHRSISRCPRILVSSVDAQLRPALAFLRGIGFVGSHAIDAHTSLLLVSSVEHTLLPKMEYLRSLGFEREEVAWMVVRSPGLLTMSIENNLKPKAEFFLRDMQGDLAELKRFPQFFSFSLERKIKPRHRMLVEHRLELRLPDMLKVSDGEFNARLIEMRLWRVEAVDG